MTRDDLAEMLADQTPACGPARGALLSGGTFTVWDSLIPANRHVGVYRRRLRTTQRRGVATLGLTETVGILERAGDEPLRIGLIQTADQAWGFMLFFNAAATTVLACARGGRVRPEDD
ncbi:hypothetical protein ACFVHB_09590 [Kitasatospora sp. NPDC127111]|uniref:hypothetical protein n=1 Tax=Kitasatospora sp. NPDC127111 TaxID=3345363 RepID=UPI00362DDCD0